MSVKEIEVAIERLNPEELSAFREWFTHYEAARWDATIEMDAATGRLDDLATEALADLRSGNVRER
ncbi:hypothetical protein [Haloferula sargassicola]|uniref:Uncharacterized protein n=1 Tax=Haloferula sargassicola TaxID=490096 RepID=A0ABP9UM65_9BACT